VKYALSFSNNTLILISESTLNQNC